MRKPFSPDSSYVIETLRARQSGRLGTGQQDTHLFWPHRLNQNNGITFDALFKSGHGDDHRYIHSFGIGVYYDRPRWFWKAYYDPHVNFSSTMVRTGIGLKF